jgi:imidazole glycerol-phosphate synthase subunit HisH
MVTIIDYRAGNVRSIQNILKKIGYKSIISGKVDDIEHADKLILPGVGFFDYGMEQLEHAGLVPILEKKVVHEKTPILGICLGAQLFTKKSEEGIKEGLGWFDAETVYFNKTNLPSNLKIPHMGWSEIECVNNSRLFSNMPDDSRFYFVHSYHLHNIAPEEVLAYCHHGYTFVAGIERENIVGIQFHPEKSHKYGMQILKNFMELY